MGYLLGINGVLTFKNSKQASSSSERIIKQSGGFLNLEDCTFESNSYNTLHYRRQHKG